MEHFIFVRHGESALNVINRQDRTFCGQMETPLTARGREQAVTAGRLLAAWNGASITTAVSSALDRARETLDLILPELPNDVRRLPDAAGLNERSLGLFDARRASDVFVEHPQYRDDPAMNQFDNHFSQKAPGGENLREVTERAWPVIEQLNHIHRGDILVVSHYTTIRCILGRALGLSERTVQRMRVPNAVPIFVQRGNGYRLVDGIDLPDEVD
jgi:2,3-bisphosphoglycerate-dependent phosphoglycerate mutase